MIVTVADFLEQFKQYALSKIEQEDKDIKHTVAIGDNFEGLTSELIGKAIFKDFNLKIVERSFIYNDDGAISNELDCLLVVGDGKRMSFTDRYKYHINDVVAVFQVKKTLYSKDIDESHQNLRSVLQVSAKAKLDPFVHHLHKDAYKLLTLKEFPTQDRIDRFTDRESFIYEYLKKEALSPLRIVIGYYGFKTEHGLREGFVKKMEEIAKDGPVLGYGPDSFPNLIICRENTIIKNTGMPMGIPLSNKEFYFEILVSSTGKPMKHLLELIWTRLSYKFRISSSIFGDNFDEQQIHPFLSCREKKIDDQKLGWEFYYMQLSHEELSAPLVPKEWQPVMINDDEYIILDLLLKNVTINIKQDKYFLKFLKDKNYEFDKFIKKLLDSRLVYIDEDLLGVLPDRLVIVHSPDGLYAGENKNGEMSSYFKK